MILVNPFQAAVITQIRAELTELLAPYEEAFAVGRDLTAEQEQHESLVIDDINTTTIWIEDPQSGYLFS